MNDLIVIEPKELSTRDKVNALEAMMREMGPVEFPVTHHFGPGVYARELFIPKGSLIVGKIHKYPQINIMSCGDLSVLTEEGIQRVQAPFTIVSPAGTKRIAYAHEDTVWTTIHGTHETDLDKIESDLIAQNDQEYEEFCKLTGETKCLGSQ